ncbi:MAG: hypothetical protein L6Q35_14000 [Phycisphaerales bacterium]|nr:hypothetical protein [Phycisphaerales bacterium]
MKHVNHRFAHALVWTLIAVAGAAVGTRIVWVHAFHGAFVPLSVAVNSDTDAATVLTRAGLDPRTLAAAGVSVPSVAGVVEAAMEEASSRAASLAAADEAARGARQTVDRLARIVQAGTASQEQIAQLSSARSMLAAAHANQRAALDAVFAAGAAQMGEAQRRIASAIRTNRSWGLPIHQLAVSPNEMSEAQWVALRDAVSCQDACARLGEEVPSQVTAAIAAAESVTDVAAAKSGLLANAGTVTAAWNQAVSGG